MPVVGTGPGELSRTWTSLLNQVVADAGTANSVEQYQNSFFEFFTHIGGTTGWTLVESAGKNGGGAHTAGAGNNILSASDVVIGTDGAEDLSWAFWSNATYVAGGTVYLLIVANNPFADAVPDLINIRLATGTVFSGGGTQASPTSAAQEAMVVTKFLPQGAFAKVNSHAHMGRSDAGDFWFGLSEDGSNVLETLFFINAADASKALEAGGPDNADWAFIAHYNSHSTGQTGGQIWGGTTSSQMPTFNGTWLAEALTFMASPCEYASGIDMDGWTGGVDSLLGRVFAAEVSVWQNNVAGRIFGTLVDFRALPQQTPIGTVDDSDAAPVRFLAVQQIALPVEDSQLPVIF